MSEMRRLAAVSCKLLKSLNAAVRWGGSAAVAVVAHK